MLPIEFLPAEGEMTAERARRWIDACLLSADLLHESDRDLLPLGDVPAERLERAHRLRAAWAEWHGRAGRVWDLTRDADGVPPALRERFGYALAMGRALAYRKIDRLRAAHAEVEAGGGTTYTSTDEMRRELGLPLRRGRSAGVSQARPVAAGSGA